ncbi:MAG: peptidoglycan editing factor PgeF [Candidatus Devosia phytovorans]|uniref:Purine nucleoside phosphorylase n=1 Tax=Candidatus Devosia phytovorans TaxID=3121372 RepID=A0AAJ5VUP1_9HYPH|nr:peptidoglycan editing factor PgeF [Devosia sp.]WEK05201.1 MAG: peptidoglycan editing factor PgeF [Devosia sp.]
MDLPFLQSERFRDTGVVRHGFFGKQGGVSAGDYASLNVSYSVGDTADNASANRGLISDVMAGGPLVTLKQVHSNRVVTVEAGALPDAAIEADGLVTRRADVLLGVLTADCAPLLFVDPHAGVIGAAHAGWKGAVTGIVENTLRAMEALGAQRRRIAMDIGPTISGENYEVGPDFMRDALSLNADAERAFFVPDGGREHFDLPRFLHNDAMRVGLTEIDTRNACTYADPGRFFSHRYATHHGSKTGRQVAVIGLA